MSTALATQQSGALAHAQSSGRMAVADIISHVAMVQEVMRAVMKPEVHYGIIPGTDKPTLYKQGAEVLCMAFRVADSYQVEDLSTADVVRYRVTCTGVHQATGLVLGTGMGEASSGEEKYKWRKAYEPEFNETPANMRRKKSGFNKAKKEAYSTFQVRTEPADLANTILKMANKRAKIAMTINVTACGDMFGQDLEDMDEALRDHLTRREGAQAAQEQPATQGNQAAQAVQPPWPTDLFAARLPEWRKAIAEKRATADSVIAKAKTKHPLTEEQIAAIRAPHVAAEPVVTFAEVAHKLNKAADADQLAEAGDLIGAVADPEHRKELAALFDKRQAELTEGAAS